MFLVYPTLGEKFEVALMLSYNWSGTSIVSWWLSSQQEHKVTYEPQDKNDIRAWLAQVLTINDSVEFLK